MDWSNCGCVVPHSRKISEWTSACNINLTAGIEFVLNKGKSRIDGKQYGLDTGDLDAFKDFEDLKAAYFDQLRHLIKNGVVATLIAQQVQAERAPRPLFSAFTEGCMESGRDLVQGGARYNVGPVFTGIGIADTANSLAAIKLLVFDKRAADLKTLGRALDSNWHGFDTLRQHGLAAPKFGNDDDYVDRFAIEIGNFYHQEISGYKDIYGSPFNSAFMGISNYIPAGKVVGATPCGRFAGEPLTEGCSPHAGTDVTSPTAAMRSTAKIDHGRQSGGTLLNIKLSPDTLKTQRDLNKLAGLIRGYFELDAFHVQFNVFDKETLLAAQRTPEQYKHLLVRVAGYSARFVTLSKEVQDAIIGRTSYASI
jgi:formate C-acetyltransferase